MEKTATLIRNRAACGAKTLVVCDGVLVGTCCDSGGLLRSMFGDLRVVRLDHHAAPQSIAASFCYKVKVPPASVSGACAK